jgi:hypothetical protein
LGLNFCVAVILSRSWGGSEHRDPLRLASLAAFGLVFELLVVKKELFPGGENELIPAVDTLEHLVLKFH